MIAGGEARAIATSASFPSRSIASNRPRRGHALAGNEAGQRRADPGTIRRRESAPAAFMRALGEQLKAAGALYTLDTDPAWTRAS